MSMMKDQLAIRSYMGVRWPSGTTWLLCIVYTILGEEEQGKKHSKVILGRRVVKMMWSKGDVWRSMWNPNIGLSASLGYFSQGCTRAVEEAGVQHWLGNLGVMASHPAWDGLHTVTKHNITGVVTHL
ncbi:hypothetical protein EDC04DRAFT_2612670 [Pisolithus marmoratus]|nr:hypothetical protein EDC04DRAFT_2612670 [Pisolithus marmoratus]